MCKYCDFYVKSIDNPVYHDILSTKTKVFNGLVTQEACVYIGNGYDKDYAIKPALKLNISYELVSGECVEGSEKAIPINFCPYCGLELKSARERYEKEHGDA